MDTILNHNREDLKRNMALVTAQEIENQPAVWKKLAAMLSENQRQLRQFMDKVLAVKDLRIILPGQAHPPLSARA